MKEHRARSWHVTLVAPARHLQLACWIWYLALVGLRFVPGVSSHLGWFMTFALVSGFAASIAMDLLGRGKFGTLELTPDRLACGTHTLDRADLRCELQIWKDPYLHTTLGAALVLRDAARRLCLGGRDHLLHSSEGRLSVERVDASLSDEDFSDLLHALSVSEARAPERERTLAIELVPSTVSLPGVLQVSGPWFSAMALVVLLGLLASAFHFERSPVAIALVEGLGLVIVIAGVVFTFRRGSRPRPARYRLLLDQQQVLLEDKRAKFGSADRCGPPLRATRNFYRSSGRFSSVEVPTMRLTWPNGKETIIGVWKTNIRWAGKVPRIWRLHYIIGPEEWRRLTAALRLH